MVRVVVLDRETGETFTEDIGDDNPVAIYVPGTTRTATRRSPTRSSATSSPRSTTRPTPTSTAFPGTTRASSTSGARDRRFSRNGTRPRRPDHRRGRPARPRARRDVPGGARRSTRAEWDVRYPLPDAERAVELVLHAAAWTNVDGAEDDPQGAAAVNVGGTQHAAELGAPLVYFSTDYVFDGAQGASRTSSRTRPPRSARTAGRSCTARRRPASEAWIVRSSWLFGPIGHNFVRTMLRLGAERDEVAVVDDQRGCPTYVGHLAAAIAGGRRAAVRRLPRRRGRRLHVGGVRRGDLRGGRPRLPRAADHDRRVRRAGAAAGVLGAALGEGRARAAALARRPARVPRARIVRLAFAPMRVLVTGGAGFIGSHFVRRLAAAGDEVVVLDKLTYAGNRGEPRRASSTSSTRATSPIRTAVAAAARGLRRDRQLRRRVARRPLDPRPGRVHPHRRPRHAGAARARAPAPASGSSRSRPTRSTATSPLGALPCTRGRSAAAVEPVLGVEGRRRPAGARLRAHVRRRRAASRAARTPTARTSTRRS